MSRHGPSTNRSFYLSLAASTLRFVIIVALVVGGVVVINQAFPAASGGGGAVPIDGGPGVTVSPSAPVSPTKTPKPLPSPTVAGTLIAVFNGTNVTGLAGDVQKALEDDYGMVQAQQAGNAPSPVAVTTIYYRTNKDKVEAEYIANEFFKRLDGVQIAKLQAGSDVDRSVQVAIYIGNDYAALKA